MYPLVLIVLSSFIASSFGEDIAERARLINYTPYFEQVIQETVYELEKLEWCNLKLEDFSQALNDLTHTHLHVTGEVHYSNGFLVSIEKIDVTHIEGDFIHRTENNITISTAYVRGNVHFRDARVGYDAVANITNDNQLHRYTGIFTHSHIETRYTINRNMNTNQTTVSFIINHVSGGSGVRMVYMPENEISEIMSLRFLASSTFSNAGRWARETIAPIILDVAKNKIEFPDVCFNC